MPHPPAARGARGGRGERGGRPLRALSGMTQPGQSPTRAEVSCREGAHTQAPIGLAGGGCDRAAHGGLCFSHGACVSYGSKMTRVCSAFWPRKPVSIYRMKRLHKRMCVMVHTRPLTHTALPTSSRQDSDLSLSSTQSCTADRVSQHTHLSALRCEEGTYSKRRRSRLCGRNR